MCQKSPQFADFPKSAYCYLHVLAEIPPQFADFPKSATGQLYLHVLAEIPPGVQIFQNLPLDSYLSYLHVLAEIPPVCRFSKICHWTATYMCLQKFPPWGADFPKSATGQLPKLPMCLQKFPPSLQIFQNLIYLHVLAKFPQGCRFSKICTGQLPKLPTCACRNSPQFADFPKSATGQLPKLPTCACRNSPPPVCRFSKIPLDRYLYVLAEIFRFSKICHWTVT